MKSFTFSSCRRVVSVLACIAFFSCNLYAAPRSSEQVLSIAKQFMQNRSFAGYNAPSSRSYNIALQSDAYFAVNASDAFLIIGADDRLPEVLGWSDKGSFSADVLPPALLFYLSTYDEDLRIMDSLGIDNPTTAPQRQRKDILSDECSPLLTTTWGQGAPYNEKCPRATNTERCPTGCVATAMAQVMNYWMYPVHGVGSNSYSWKCSDCAPAYSSAEILSANFGSTTYQWDNMRESFVSGAYSSEQAASVATLMYQCGVAVNMEYGYLGSGANFLAAKNAFIYNFGYDGNIQLFSKTSKTADQLKQYIRDELASQRPVIIGGVDPETGGHAFVCDGYNSSEYFHINWGWNGTCDGYFLLTALTPSYAGQTFYYSNDVQFLTNIMPSASDPTMTNDEMKIDYLKLIPSEGSRQSIMTCSANRWMYMGWGVHDAMAGLALFDEDDNQLFVLDTIDASTLHAYHGRQKILEMNALLPDSLPDGTYYLDFVYKSVNEDDSIPWNHAKYNTSACGPVIVYLSDDNYSTKQCKGTPVDGSILSCEEAISVAEELTAEEPLSETYTIEGYITRFLYFGVKDGKQCFWMGDDHSNVDDMFKCNWCKVPHELHVGDKVAVTGHLSWNYHWAEIANGTVTLLQGTAVEQTTLDSFDPEQPYVIYNMHGQQLCGDIYRLDAGVYIIRQGTSVMKIVK